MSVHWRTTFGLMLSAALVLVASQTATQAAQPAKPGNHASSAADHANDISAQRRRPARVRIYGTARPLAPTAVRQCRAWYAPEYRASGTVITPRMQCWWDNG